ncbi:MULTISPECIES: hypothetical protein [Stenotrophomonas]|uniref:hypothetical protein n=1 Tax=Stenotrophomonas TaxID=40323 RepID=UPI000BC40C9B|nr:MULTISPECIES: hypothetical protein [Stenotrophomonas]MCA7024934.1 hypothetical protein [Stenotrophomonas acidaminiphila]MCE4074633.1 hypothetical protein [Stenotrophomonas acidaminiphila]OZB64241.1 MAG: hypothetical protein B7X39_17215 [Xanthomonadales bacterium 14-68-21]
MLAHKESKTKMPMCPRERNIGERNLQRTRTNTDEQIGVSAGLVLRFPDLLELTRVGRSKAYAMMNPKDPGFDPTFPVGFPLYDTPRSPKGYWRHEAVAWLEGRSAQFMDKIKGKN